MTSHNNGVEKKRFTFDIIDSSARMSGVAFDNECIRFFDLMKLDGIYEISGTGINEVKNPPQRIPYKFQIAFSKFTKVNSIFVIHLKCSFVLKN